jgi:hypothetical protein
MCYDSFDDDDGSSDEMDTENRAVKRRKIDGTDYCISSSISNQIVAEEKNVERCEIFERKAWIEYLEAKVELLEARQNGWSNTEVQKFC